MKPIKTATAFFSHCLVLTALLGSSNSYAAQKTTAALAPTIDNFDHQQTNSLGIARLHMSDAVAGGNTTTVPTVADGVLHIKGEILPPRGQPGWASTVLPLGPEGQNQDASQFEGIRVVIKVDTGNISISANSTEITNFDYHTKPIPVAADGQFHEVKIPFKTMKRVWSEQTPLNTKTLHSLSIVAFNTQAGVYDYAIDEVSFY